MQFFFQNPLYLLGLGAVALPIIIHLMERRREFTVRLPTIRFILEAHRRTSRRLKVRRWLLLLVRMLMVCALVMIMARPVVIHPQSLLNPGLPGSTILILDNSPSMALGEHQGQSRWEEALRLAREMVRRTVPPGEMVLLDTGEVKPPPGFSRDAGALLADLEALSLSQQKTDLTSVLNAAYRVMEEASHSLRQIVYLTDMTRTPWAGFGSGLLERPDLNIPFRVVDLSRGVEGWNAAIGEMEITVPPGGRGIGRVRVDLTSYGEMGDRTATLELNLNGRLLGRRMVGFGPEQNRSAEFTIPEVDEGLHRLTAALDMDPLSFDNRYHGVFSYGGGIRVLTVDGSPKASLMGSETFFLRAALLPERFTRRREVRNVIVFPDQLRMDLIEEHDVVILANVRAISPEVASGLSSWVSKGGGLIIFLGDSYDQETYRAAFDAGGADLLPAFLGRVEEPPGEGLIRFLDPEWPPLSLFLAPRSGDFSRAKFQHYVSLGAGGLKPGARVLMAFDQEGRSPLLMERVSGEGRILLFTSSADLDWNNLPVQTVYLPLVNRSVESLAGPRGLAVRPGFLSGEDILLSVENLVPGQEVPVVTPGGSRGTARVERSGQAVYRSAMTAGFYDFHLGNGEAAVPVNASRGESDIRILSSGDLQSLAGVLPVEVIEPLEGRLGEESLRASMDLTHWFFFALLFFLVAEGLMSSGVRRLMEGGKA